MFEEARTLKLGGGRRWSDGHTKSFGVPSSFESRRHRPKNSRSQSLPVCQSFVEDTGNWSAESVA